MSLLQTLKCGLKPFVPNPKDFLFRKYVDISALPPLPKQFGFEGVYPADAWGMLGNDKVGNCVFAGAAHEHMLWGRANGRELAFTEEGVISDYSAVTGYNPADPTTDQGTDMRQALKYRQDVGIVDADGNRHKIGAYMLLDKGDLLDIWYATYLGGVAAIGFYVPQSAMRQFERGATWTVRPLQPMIGGHYVPSVARRDELEVVTWGKIQRMDERFYRRYAMEAYAIFSEEWLREGKAPNGFDRDQLLADLKEIGK